MRPEIARAILKRPDFRRLYATRLAGQCGDGVFQASLAGAVLFNPERQSQPLQVAAAFALVLLPYSFIGPFAGVLLDRWSRQRLLVLANLLRCLFVAWVATAIATGTDGSLFYVGALGAISINRFMLSAISASLPHVVESRQLITANSLSVTSGGVAAVIGGILAVAIQHALGGGNHGYATVAICSAVGYLGSALAAQGFPHHLLGPDNVQLCQRETLADVFRGLVAGAKHVRARPAAYHALAAIGGHRFFYGISLMGTLLLYRNYFHDEGVFRAGLPGLAQLIGAGAVGALLAAIVTPSVTLRIGRPRWMTILFGTAAVVQVVLGIPFQMQTFLPAALILAFVAQGSKICVDTTVQESIEDNFRGRVFSLYDMLFNVTFVSAATVGALVLPISGKSYLIVLVVAAGYAGIAVFNHFVTLPTARRTFIVRPQVPANSP